MATIQELQQLTADFFARHWDRTSNQIPPVWSGPWSFAGPVPFNDHKGCYAFLRGEDILYVGVALSAGMAGYEHHGIGKRVSCYWVLDQSRPPQAAMHLYRPTEKLVSSGIDAIITLGFPPAQEYLAASLEYYLIQQLQPSLNQVHKQLR